MQTPQETKKHYGVGAEFSSAHDLLHAAEAIKNKGFVWWDAHSPVPIHGMDKAKGADKSLVSLIALLLGLFGLFNALFLQIVTASERPPFLHGVLHGWYSCMLYPIVTSGKPYFDLIGNFPVNAVLTIQLTGYGAFIGFLICTFLPRLYNPIFNWERFCRKASNDGFFLTIEAADPRYQEAEVIEILEQLGGKNITVIPKD